MPTIEICATCDIPLIDEAPVEPDSDVHDPFGVLSREHTIYPLDDWDEHQLLAVEQGLAEAGIPFAWDPDGLAVPTDREEATEELLDGLEHPDQLPESHADDDDDIASTELMHELFLRSDRLVRDPAAPIPRADFVAVAEAAHGTSPPFGFNPEWWDQIQLASALIRRDVLDDADPGDVAHRAKELRDAIRPYV